MKKLLSVFLVVLISVSLLAGSALAKSGNGNQSSGAPKQQQSNKGNRDKSAGNGKGNAKQSGQTDRKNKNNEDKGGKANGQGNEEKDKNPQFYRQGNPLNIQAVSDAISQLTDTELSEKLTGLLNAYKDAKPGQDAQGAWTALLDALKAAGIPLEKVQPVRRQWTEQQGKPIDVDAISAAIGQLTDADAAAKLNGLLLAYREAEVGKAVHEALTALLDALEAAGIDVALVQPPIEDEETPDQDEPIDVEKITAAISQLTDSAVATQLTGLLTAYQEAVTAGESAVQAALTALLDALKAAGITEGIE